MSQITTLIVIPARMGSTRFPGKPLAPIKGKPMIQWVYEQATQSKADMVVVATDSGEIEKVVTDFGGNAMLTSPTHANGTARCAEVLEEMESSGEYFDVMINIQGDEPLVDPNLINRIIDSFAEEETEIVTAANRISDQQKIEDPNCVKVVLTAEEDGSRDALYFSRAPIPFARSTGGEYFQHQGIYGFRAEIVPELMLLPVSAMDQAENLEQLRWMYHHFLIEVITTSEEAIGVDTPADIAHVENLLERKNS